MIIQYDFCSRMFVDDFTDCQGRKRDLEIIQLPVIPRTILIYSIGTYFGTIFTILLPFDPANLYQDLETFKLNYYFYSLEPQF